VALSLDQQLRMLAELHRLSAERETAERQMRAEFETASARVQRELSDGRQTAIMRFQIDRDETQRKYDAAVAAANSIYETRHDLLVKEQQQAIAHAQNDFSKAQRRAKRVLSEESWEANTVYEATHNAPKLQLEQESRELSQASDVLRQVVERVNQHLVNCRLNRVVHPPLENAATIEKGDNPALQLRDLAKAAIAQLETVTGLPWPRWLVGGKPWGVALLIAAAAFGGAYGLFGAHLWVWLALGTIVSTSAIIGGGIWLYKQAKTSVSAPYEELHTKLEQGAELHRAALVIAKDRCAIESQRILTHRDQELNSAQAKFEQKIAESTSTRDTAVETAKQKYAQA